jgi:bilirubin oxidase
MGPFTINDTSFNMGNINVVTHINNTEIWTLINNTMIAHPFHVHDVFFYILDINGVPPPVYERGKKDVVLVMPGDTVRFITKFEDFADETTPYMYHCHLLHHEDDGMMGQFIVMPDKTAVKPVNKDAEIQLYPNPATASLTITTNNQTPSPTDNLTIYNAIGAKVYSAPLQHSHTVSTNTWPAGIYHAVITVNNEVINRALVVE